MEKTQKNFLKEMKQNLLDQLNDIKNLKIEFTKNIKTNNMEFNIDMLLRKPPFHISGYVCTMNISDKDYIPLFTNYIYLENEKYIVDNIDRIIYDLYQISMEDVAKKEKNLKEKHMQIKEIVNYLKN